MKRFLLTSTVLAAVLALAVPEAQATTFNLSTLNEENTGSSRYPNYQWTTGPNGTGTEIFNNSVNQLTPWTEGTGGSAASLNFSIPGQGNNSGKTYMSAGALFPIPAGQTLGQNQSGYSGEYATGSSYPLYFAFSNPTYDNNCGFNCNTITPKQVVLNSFDISTYVATGITVLGYSGLPNQGGTLLDTYTTTTGSSGITNILLDWTGIEYVDIVGSGPGSCFAGYACASGFYVNDIEVNDPLPAPVPEPASLTILGLGLTGIGILRHRRHGSPAA